MTSTSLNTSTEQLLELFVDELEADGYAWNRSQQTLNEYLATALTDIGGSTVSHLRLSTTQLLAGIVNAAGGGPASNLQSNYAELLSLGIVVLEGGIQFSPSALLDDAAVGDDVGTASAPGTTGTAVWALDDDDGGKYSINSSTGLVEVADTLTAGTDSITISVSGLTPAPAARAFSITVTSSATNFTGTRLLEGIF